MKHRQLGTIEVSPIGMGCMGLLHTHKKCAFLMAYANTSAKDAEAMNAHYKTIADYMGWEDVGSVVAPGIWTAGSIKGTKYAKQAYELGKSL